MLSIFRELNFYFTFKDFNHGNEFHGYVCRLPFEYAELTSNGDISVCCYLPKNIGNERRIKRRLLSNKGYTINKKTKVIYRQYPKLPSHNKPISKRSSKSNPFARFQRILWFSRANQ